MSPAQFNEYERQAKVIEQHKKYLEKKYQVQANPKNNSSPYLIYDGEEMTLESAKTECDACNKYWGDRIEYKIIEAKK